MPNLEGATLAVARRRLAKRRLEAEVQGAAAVSQGRVVSQSPRAGVAAAPGRTVELVVAPR